MTDDGVARWRGNSDIIERIIDGEAVLLDLKTGVYYSLNETGTAVWKSLGEARGAAEIGELLSAGYEVEPGRAAADAESLLAELAAEKLIEKA